jgi:tetratricopeptide (TPR) repeat protein
LAEAAKAIEAAPDNSRGYRMRGSVYSDKGSYAEARVDYDKAIGLEPHSAPAYAMRASFFKRTGEYQKALSDLLEAHRLSPTRSEINNELAWYLATCPDPTVRDGTKACEYVDRALEMFPVSPPTWDTCAAVLAELSDFDEAVKWEQRYLESKNLTETQRKRGQARLALYRAHQPYRVANENDFDPDQLGGSTSPAPPRK